MAFGSRGKGSKAEREVAKLLCAWWSPVEPGCQFAPTPGSGGWSTAHNRAGFGTAGDLVTTAKAWPWAVEVKRRESWVWKSLEAGTRSPVWAWWIQAQRAADEMKKQPMMFFRKNNQPWLVFIPRELDGRIPQAIRAKKVWAAVELAKVDYGGILPVCYEAKQLLRAPAKLFVVSKAA